MSDYKGIFAQEDWGESLRQRKKVNYLVNVIHSETKEVAWSGVVEAFSSKNAQTQWRKEYPNIRSQYDHSYCLAISRI